jgi:hypothetical protein
MMFFHMTQFVKPLAASFSWFYQAQRQVHDDAYYPAGKNRTIVLAWEQQVLAPFKNTQK